MIQPKIAAIRHIMERLPASGQIGAEVKGYITEILSSCTVVANLRDSPDLMKSELAIDKDVLAAKIKLNAAIGKARDLSTARLGTFKASLAQDQLQMANLKSDSFAAEIRAVFRTSSDEGRTKILTDCLTKKDGATAAALLEGPMLLSGMSEARAATFREHFLNTVAPMTDAGFARELGESVNTVLSIADEIAQTA
ncbi:MAG: hypothetical protein Q8L02_06225 [Candidatus Nitrotoga sp.]|nr:hypothetical protein [Candidatus Nitrotoga sp.]